MRAGAAALVAALCAGALAPGAAASAPAPPGPNVSAGTTSSGTRYIVRPFAGAPVAAISLWYRAPSMGYGRGAVLSLARLSAQTVVASKPLVGDSVGTLVRAAGGRLAITVYGDTLSIGAVVPAPATARIVRAMTAAFFAPVATDAGLSQAQKDVTAEALLEAANPATVARNELFAALFAGGPQHFAPLGDPKEIGSIGLPQVRAFADRAFRSQNAVIVLSGAVGARLADAIALGRPQGEAPLNEPEVPGRSDLAVAAAPVVRNFEAAGGGYAWIGPGIADEREATAMDFIADFLFHGDTGYVTQPLSDSDPDAAVLGQFVTLSGPGVLFVTWSGKNAAALRARVDDGIALVRSPLAPATFAAAKTAFTYHLLSDVQTPGELADVYGWYTVEGNPGYAPVPEAGDAAYFTAARSLTPAFVAATAQKYLGGPPATVVFAKAPKASARPAGDPSPSPAASPGAKP